MIAPAGSQACTNSPRLRLDCCRALLRLLCEHPPAWNEIAETVSRDPLLAWSILNALPLAGDHGEQELASLIENRVTRLGADLLRAWALHASLEASDSPVLERRSAHALLVAELAAHVARQIEHPCPRDAYLAGLWHDLSALFGDGDPQGLEDGNVRRRAEHSMNLAERAGTAMPILDAIRLNAESEDCIADSHALSRIVWVARSLAEGEPAVTLASLSRVAGLPTRVLIDLREEFTYLIGATDERSGGAGERALPLPKRDLAHADPTSGPEALPWINAASRGLMQGAFLDLDEQILGDRLYASCALLTGQHGPQLVLEAHGERLQPVLSRGVDAAWLDGIALRTDNHNSTLALALHRATATSYAPAEGGPGRSTVDWQLGRWLGGGGFTAWPWQVDGRVGVAVFAHAAQVIEEAVGARRRNLLDSALGELMRMRRRLAEREAREESALRGFRDRVRRMQHETSNPLSLIRSYLDLIRERHGADAKTREDLAILGSEIDRIGQMLRRMGDTDGGDDEAPYCLPNEVLRDLATLCSDTLFASRGLSLELRLAASLPAARMPRSILRQILLNLLRNAAEALPAGGRVTLASSGPVAVDGRLCVEIRVVDNGPGMPQERFENLYALGDSAKGEGNRGSGLSIVRELLHEYNAAMICRSQDKAGTGMQIFIPARA
ncbi:MAG: HDOD domain-containing protein [Rhodocyclaceae bacterium]|nr:HDOD domain-containing protein [Rhodocyclaceae bacterium]